MSLKLKDRSKVPPGHAFPYRDAETGHFLSAGNFPALQLKVSKHRESNQLVPLADTTIEDNCCRQLVAAGHSDFCEDTEHAFLPISPKHKLRLSDYIRGSLTIGENLLRGNPKVEQAEANRRAFLCAGCPHNVTPVDCTACNMNIVRSTVERIVGKSKTPSDDKLKSCFWCGCFNRVQVWFELPILHRYMRKEINEYLPAFCWKKLP